MKFLNGKNYIRYKRNKVNTLTNAKGEKEFLCALLKLMQLRVAKEKAYQELVEDFTATYVFQGQKKGAYIVAEFKNNKIYLSKKRLKAWDFRVYFKSEKYLYKFLLGEDGEYQEAVREQEVEFTGNLNYIRRLTFMAKMTLMPSI